MGTAEERASSALIILGNPQGTFPVSNSDIPELLNYSRDPNPAVRHMAVYQLQQLRSTSFYNDILPLLVDGDISVSRITEELMLKNEKASIEAFREALKSEDREMKLKALDLLIKLDDRESLAEIIALFSDSDGDVVSKAIAAAAGLADVNDKILFDTLLRPEISLRIGIVKTFSKLGDPSVLGTLLPYFYDPEVKVQNAVKFAFIDFGDQSIPYLLNVLGNPVTQTQLAVLGLLEALQNSESIPSIIELFKSENERVKTRAVYTVSTFKEEAVHYLGESLQQESEAVVISSIGLLSGINDDDSLSYLIPLLNHENLNIRNAVFEALLLFHERAGDKFLKILDRRNSDLYESAVKGLILLKDIRLIIDNETSLYNRNNRHQAFIQNSSYSDLTDYLENVTVSGLIVRDFTFIKEISLAAVLLIQSERKISETGSRYTTFYISKNEFLKKSEEALILSFTYMHNYMESKDPEDLETAKKQQEFSEMFKTAASDLEDQLENYIGSTDEEKRLIHSFESSRDKIVGLYESVSLNRKNLADDILSISGLTYKDILSGNLTSY
jgi:HEAT repeat protein